MCARWRIYSDVIAGSDCWIVCSMFFLSWGVVLSFLSVGTTPILVSFLRQVVMVWVFSPNP